MFIFNISSTVYASHKSKDERFVVTGTLVSTGLAAVGKAGIIAALCAVGLRLGLDMNSTTQSALDKFIEDNPDLINQENFGKSQNGLIAVSKNVVDKFTSFLNEFSSNPILTLDLSLTKEQASKLHGYTSTFVKGSRLHYTIHFEPQGYELVYSGTLTLNYDSSATYPHYPLTAKIKYSDGRTSSPYINHAKGINITFPSDFGTYVPDNALKDDNGNVYTGNGDFILNPSWDIGANQGVLEGLPALPWEDKTFGSTGQVGVLNPDGTITVPDSIPDVENPDVPDADIGEQTGILGWLSKFWENLWKFFMELVKALFYPTAAINAWKNLKNTINNNFKFIGQLNSINWSTDNNQRLKIPFSYAKTTTYITIPDFIEDNYVHIFRNLFKYFIYALTLFVCVQILRPKLSVGTR